MAPVAIHQASFRGVRMSTVSTNRSRSVRRVASCAASSEKREGSAKAALAGAVAAGLVAMGSPMQALADYGTYATADKVPEECKKICASNAQACTPCVKSWEKGKFNTGQ